MSKYISKEMKQTSRIMQRVIHQVWSPEHTNRYLFATLPARNLPTPSVSYSWSVILDLKRIIVSCQLWRSYSAGDRSGSREQSPKSYSLLGTSIVHIEGRGVTENTRSVTSQIMYTHCKRADRKSK